MTNKIRYTGLLAFFCLSLLACSKKTYPSTAEVSYLGNPFQGVVSISALGYGTTEREAEFDTFITGFEAILFRGLPAFAGLRAAMINDESKAKSQHSQFFKKFFDERGYLQFVSEQGKISKLGRSDQPGKIKVQKTFSVNYEAMRKKLEQEGVIRKFGY